MDKTIEEFFKKYIHRWMLNDIKVCVDNNANFGAVTLICCYIDFLGKLYTGNDNSGFRFKKFINDYFNDKYSDYSEFIYETFRCGMVHSFFPLKEGGIIGGYGRKDEHLELFNNGGEGSILINKDILFDDFKEAISNYYKNLKKDPKLQKIFLDTLEGILKEKNDSFEKLKKRIISFGAGTKNKAKISISGSTIIEIIPPDVISDSRSALSQDIIDKDNKNLKNN